MELAVRDQVTLQRKSPSALLTHEGPVAGMNTQMRQQMMLEGEAFLALAALIRTLGGVEQQMRV
jgi:hypothetical protein